MRVHVCEMELKPKKIQVKMNKELETFADFTTIHALPRAIKATGKKERCLWTLVLLTTTGIFIVQVANLIQKYLTYPTSVDISVVYNNAKFPWVTICSNHAIDQVISARLLHKGQSLYNQQVPDDIGDFNLKETVPFETYWNKLDELDNDLIKCMVKMQKALSLTEPRVLEVFNPG